MQNYKLIKKYPGLPKDWEEGMLVGQGDRGVQGGYSPCNAKYSDNKRIPLDEVINNPEYWERIYEPNYEVLSIAFGDDIYYKTGETTKDFPSGKEVNVFRVEGKVGMVTDMDLKPEGKWNTKINSVKRLSDGEVFSIKDYCNVLESQPKQILSIEINDEFLGGVKLTHKGGAFSIGYEGFKVEKKYLFTTSDGVDIFEGDEWWYVKLGNLEVRKTNSTKYIGNPNYKQDVLRFSTQELANEYANNQVIFTTTDGVDMYKGDSFWVPQVKGITNEYSGVILECKCRGSVHTNTKDGKTKTFSTEQAAIDFLNPIITTEDGVNLVVGDSYWFVWLNTPATGQKALTPYFVKKVERPTANISFAPRNTARFYKSESKIKEFIKNYPTLNKVTLTGQDVLDYLESVDLKVENVDPQFIKFVKNKIKSRGL